MFKCFLMTTCLLIMSVKTYGASVDLDSILNARKASGVQFYCTDKPDNSFMSVFSQQEAPKTWFCKGVLLTEQGHVLVHKSMMRNREGFYIKWKDANGNIFNLDTQVVSEHPKEDAAIVKVEHPFGEKFPAPPLAFEKIYKNKWVIVLTRDIDEDEVFFQLGRINTVFREKEGVTGLIGLSHSRGQLGSPVYNLSGEMIGFVDGYSDYKDLMFIQPLSSISDWIQETIGI